MATTTLADNKALVHEYLAAWADGDPAALTGLLADDVSMTITTSTGEEGQLGVEGLQELMADFVTAFSDQRNEISGMVAEDDRVITHITYSGTHDAAFLGIEATGTRVEVEEFLSCHIANDEIVELQSLADTLDLLRQLGVDLPIDTEQAQEHIR